jgi:hypothetical protein
MSTASFLITVSTSAGDEQLWLAIATLTREHGRHHLEDFEAKREGVEFDSADFLAYCRQHGDDPDLLALACESLETESAIDHEAARGDWLYEQAKERGLG